MDYLDQHAHQIFATEHVINNKFCGLLLDMGLGKTVATLTAIDILINYTGEIKHVLVVAPKRVVETVWKDETTVWSHLNRLNVVNIVGNEKERLAAAKTPADIHVVSRDNFSWLVDHWKMLNFQVDMLVLDELSSFKSSTTQRFKAAKAIRPYMKRVVGLTGTPTPKSLLDLWAEMYLLDMGARLERTLTAYRTKYFEPASVNGHIVYSYKLKPDCEGIIHSKISDICISMKSVDYSGIKEPIYNFVEIEMPASLRKQHDEFVKEKVLEVIGDGETKEIPVVTAAALSNKLLQFANGAVYDEDKNFHIVHDLKIDALIDLIEEANGESILVAWSYRHDLVRLKEALKKYTTRELKTKQDIDDWNAGKIHIGLAHPASLGHGINLQFGGHIIVWFGLTWSLELYQQFNKRLPRPGQKHSTVIIHHIVLRKSHDTDVVKAIMLKDKGQESLMASVKAKLIQYIK